MGFRLEEDNVWKIVSELIDTNCPWDYGNVDDPGYMKTLMYYTGVMDMAKEVIRTIKELKKA